MHYQEGVQIQSIGGAMIHVHAMPGELAAAHAGRYRTLNRVHPARLLEALSGKLDGDENVANGLCAFEMLAAMSNMSAQSYASAHSMLPVLRLAARQEDVQPHGSPHEQSILLRSGLASPKSHGHVCPECVQADRAAFGFSWFRREHQLFGVDWCHMHRDALLMVTHPDPFSALPHVWLAKGMVTHAKGVVHSLEGVGSFLQRFTTISTAMLERGRPVSTAALHGEVRKRSAERGLRRMLTGRRPPLSSLLQQLAPSEWIQRHLPSIREVGRYGHLPGLDDFVSKLEPTAGHIYLLAIACLFDSADEVLECFPVQGVGHASWSFVHHHDLMQSNEMCIPA